MLLYFILGIILITVILPFIQNIMSITTAWSEYIVYKFAFKIYEIKKEMEDEPNQEKEKNPVGFHTQAIGFQASETLEQEEM